MAETVRRGLERALVPYRAAFDDVRWLDPATWHVTLVFLGSAPATAIPALGLACDRVAARWPPFELDIASGGGRVQRGDGVAWLWVRRNTRGVIELAEDLDWAVRRADATIPEPRRAPSAHVTVARRADRSLLDSFRDERLGALRAAWTADRIGLMRSHLDSSGARYETIHESPLSAPLET